MSERNRQNLAIAQHVLAIIARKRVALGNPQYGASLERHIRAEWGVLVGSGRVQ